MTLTGTSSIADHAAARAIPGPPLSESHVWLRRVGKDILRSMDRLTDEYGDVSKITIGVQDIVVARGAEAAKRILVSNQDNYRKSHQFDLFRPILGNGLVTSEGATWQRSRRLVNPMFAKRHLAVYAEHMSAAAAETVDAWDRQSDGRTVDLDAEMLRIGLDTVFRALVSEDLGRMGGDLGSLISAALHEIGQMSRTPAAFLLQDVPGIGITRAVRAATPLRWRRYAKLAGRADAVIARLVDDRLTWGHRGKDDLLTLLIGSLDPETGETLTRRQVIDEVATFIAAGHETTAHGLAWMFHLLGRHSAERDRLEAEIATVMGARRLPTVGDAERMPFLKACFQEAMRLYPPVWHIPRLATGDDVLAGHRIRAGSRVLLSIWSTHRDPSVYDRPLEFVPDRWLGDAPGQRPRFSYFPFGGGRRACVGQSFAMLNATLLGAVVAARYRFEPSREGRIALEPTITLRPAKGIPAIARRRTT